jgi:hypothetical protein
VTFTEFINETAWLGYVLGSVLVVLGVVVVATLLTRDRVDDGYRWLGDEAEPVERRSPFAPVRPAELTETCERRPT